MFKLKDINFIRKIIKLNIIIEIFNFQNKKSKIDFFILFITITKIMILYKHVKENNFKTKMNLLIKI